MFYAPGTAYYGQFATHRYDTGAAANADALPTATATRNGADDGSFTLTVANIDTGRYKITGTVPSGYAVGDRVQISVAATINSVATKQTVGEFQVDFPSDQQAARAAHRAARAWFVSTAGNDGNDGKSWATAKLSPKTVIEAATAGDVVVLGAGTFALGSNYIEVPDGVKVCGAGMWATTITSTKWFSSGADSTGKAIVRPGNGSIIEDLYIQGLNTDGSYQMCVGTNGGGSQAAFVGAQINRVRMLADSDGFYALHDTACSATLRDCIIETYYDATNLKGQTGVGAHRVDLYNCLLSVNGQSSGITSASASALKSTGGTIRAFGCWLIAKDSKFNGDWYTAAIYANGSTAGTAARVETHNCYILSSKTVTQSKKAADVRNVSGVVVVDNCWGEFIADPANKVSGTISYSDPAGGIRAQTDSIPTVQAVTDQLGTMTEQNGDFYRFTADALTQATDPWSVALPGTYAAGAAGKIVGDNLNAAIDSRLAASAYAPSASAADIRQEIDSHSTQLAAIVDDTNELQSRFATMLEQDGSDWRLKANALESAFLVNMADVEADAPNDSLCTMVLACFHFGLSGSTWTIKKTDGTTKATKTVAHDASAKPVVGVS